MMVDWVSAKIPLSHEKPIHGGQVVSYDANGEFEFSTAKRLSVEGSYSGKVTIRTLHTGIDGEIEFSGNPVKFLKGHNLYGSTDIIGLMKHALERIFRDLRITPTPANWQAILNGEYSLSRVDINKMIAMGSRAEVLAWIRVTSHASRSRHKSGGILRGDTLYFGKHSRRWAMKLYSKGQEIEVNGHQLPDLPSRDLLTQWAQDKLRWELVLRGAELRKQGIHTAATFVKADLCALFDSYKQRITIPKNEELPTATINQLPRHLRSTYTLWKSGEDPRQLLSKNTFYRHRRLLFAHGIDISICTTLPNQKTHLQANH